MKTLMIILLTIGSLQTYTIKGFVRDELGNSIAGVRVSTLDDKFDYSDFDGSFTIKTNDSIGVIKAKIYGFKKQEVDYKIDGSTLKMVIILKK